MKCTTNANKKMGTKCRKITELIRYNSEISEFQIVKIEKDEGRILSKK